MFDQEKFKTTILESVQSLVDAVPAVIDKLTDLLADKEPPPEEKS
jgi:hypothetical protein